MGWQDAPEEKTTGSSPAWMSAPEEGYRGEGISSPRTNTEGKINQWIGESLSAPFRGFRGMAVGYKHLLPTWMGGSGKSLQGSLERATEATKPGYVPQEGEKLASFMGGAIPLAPLGLGAGSVAAGLSSSSEAMATGTPANEAMQQGAVTGLASYGLGKGIEKGLSVVGEGVGFTGRLLKSLYRSKLSGAKGTNRQVVNGVLDALDENIPEVTEAAKPFLDRVSQIQDLSKAALDKAGKTKVVGATEADIAQKGVAVAKALRDASFKIADTARESLPKDEIISQDVLLSPIKQLRESLKVRGSIPGVASKKAESVLASWEDDIVKMTEGGKNLSPFDLKNVLKKIDGDTQFEGPADEPIKAVLRELGGFYRKLLSQNDDFAQSMSKSSKMINTAESIENALGLKRMAKGEISSPDTAMSKIRGIIRGGKPMGEEALKKGGMSELLKSARTRISAETAKTEAMNQAAQVVKAQYPDIVNVRRMAETAARQGMGSPPHMDLRRVMVQFLGEKDGGALADRLVKSGAKDIFNRLEGSHFTGIKGGILNTKLSESDIVTLGKIDNALQSIGNIGGDGSAFNRTGSVVGRGVPPIVGGLRNILGLNKQSGESFQGDMPTVSTSPQIQPSEPKKPEVKRDGIPSMDEKDVHDFIIDAPEGTKFKFNGSDKIYKVVPRKERTYFPDEQSKKDYEKSRRFLGAYRTKTFTLA